MGTIGENIRRERMRAGFKTQGEFAVHLGLPQPRVSDIEKGRSVVPELPTLLRFAKALGVSIDTLLQGVDPDYDAICDPLRHTTGNTLVRPVEAQPDDVSRKPEASALSRERAVELSRALLSASTEIARIAATLTDEDAAAVAHRPSRRRSGRSHR